MGVVPADEDLIGPPTSDSFDRKFSTEDVNNFLLNIHFCHKKAIYEKFVSLIRKKN